jgi:hypothetical protein
VTRSLQSDNLEVSRPDSHVYAPTLATSTVGSTHIPCSNKAVSEGAAAFAVDHYVGTRISKAFFGVDTTVPYVASNPGHLRRQNKVAPNTVTLQPSLSGFFTTVLHKVQTAVHSTLPFRTANTSNQNVQVSEAKEYRCSFARQYKTLQDLQSKVILSQGITKYCGNLNDPQWMDDEPGTRKPSLPSYRYIQPSALSAPTSRELYDLVHSSGGYPRHPCGAKL